MTLPRLPPAATNPIARARLVVKYVATRATLGRKMQPRQSPTQTPYARNTCQYSVARLNIIIPKTDRNVPTIIKVRKYPRSKIGPAAKLKKTRRKAWKVPIHDMSDALRDDRRSEE